MTRLGIVIAVSENLPPLKSLSACANDGAAISDILKQTNRFDDILVLIDPKDTISASLKDKIALFVEKHKSAEVEEVVFYFSGHGDFVGNEFYHILSDYDSKSRNRTSLANSELDAMIRGLAPRLFVKIVDACHSGTSYIKSNEGLGDFLKGTRTGFKDLYFLYSSQTDQISWTDGQLSAFTKCLIGEIGRRDTGAVRYRDLMSAASDYFEASGEQTPQFVTQADFTQIFCESSKAMQIIVQKYIPSLLPTDHTVSPTTEAKPNSSLLDLIREMDARYSSREEAYNAFQVVKSELQEFELTNELKEIFSVELIASEGRVDEIVFIGEWLAKNGGRGFFATPSYKSVNYKRRIPRDKAGLASLFSAKISNLFDISDNKGEMEVFEFTRQEVSGYNNTCILPFQSLTIHLRPMFQCLLPVECQIVPIISPTHLRLFWSIQQFKRTDWDTTVPAEHVLKWESAEAAVKAPEEIKLLPKNIKNAFVRSIEKIMSATWPVVRSESKIQVDKDSITLPIFS